MVQRDETEVEEIEIELLIQGLYRHYGVDLRDYTRAWLWPRIRDCMRQEEARTISGFQERVLHDGESMERFMLALATNQTSMFHDPDFYLAFRARVVPQLRTYPFIRIWQAGCSTGEEVYSMAIMLEEEGLYHRARIYATDNSREAVKRAREGVFLLGAVPRNTTNYLQAGGRKYLSEYFAVHEGKIFFNPALRRNVIFSEHNLATDSSFNEFQVVLCRNVMDYFNRDLQERVHELIYDSLTIFGFVGLGRRESLRYSPHEAFYETLDEENRIYRKVM
jgi:chemotaxis protein methyltransferase CheR